jgi:GPH family glycoside/pentoside/hexuronide:cation symporter
MGVMTSNLKERTSISSFRFFGAYGGAAIAVGLIPYLVNFIGKGNDNIGYQKTMYLLAGLLVILSLITFIATRERVFPPKDQLSDLYNDFRDLVKNRPWAIMLIIGFLFVTYNSIKQGIAMYFFTHYLGKSVLGGIYLLTLLITSILATFLATPLTEFFGKKKLFIIVLLFSGLVNALLFFAGPEDIYYVFIIGNISEVGAAIMPILFFSMLGDSADYSEFKNNRRATGLVFSAGTFAMKFGGGVAGAIMLLVMKFFGYDGQAEVKTKEALLGIRLDMSLVPLLFIIIAVIIISFYPLTQTKMNEIEKELELRRNKN